MHMSLIAETAFSALNRRPGDRPLKFDEKPIRVGAWGRMSPFARWANVWFGPVMLNVGPVQLYRCEKNAMQETVAVAGAGVGAGGSREGAVGVSS